ncbi:MAG: UV DNA damage repair endonuclease UvsE [Eubacteriales bacterium]|nr:UV DNA damage repair endonuclease UvsE [Eubacteriales bacterium]MDD3349375.1 UV DNA damage repair endonuclease UvsE [Eubacteriales bacterium]
MNIGYACLTVGVPGTKQRTCSMKNATPDVLRSIIETNLESLNRIVDYNIQNGIKLFRISSDIIPFGSHSVNTLRWWEEFGDKLQELGQKAMANGIRLSMHPGQYTVLNSTDEAVVARAIDDLHYHTRFLDAMGLGGEHKLILHIGGVYGDKDAATKRFIKQYHCLDANVQKRLVIENDDRQYTISDVLRIGESECIPVVFDNLHHQVNCDNSRSVSEWIHGCSETWKASDGVPKLHYSQADKEKRAGAHSATLAVDDFLEFYSALPQQDMDIMLEVKDKNLSAIKCINAIAAPKIQRLEKEWERYKYLVLERSPNSYNEIRQLLKDKTSYPLSAFYQLIDEAMETPVTAGNAVNAAQHVWGYFRELADEKTRLRVQQNLNKVSQGGSTKAMKRLLWNLAETWQQKYLLDSLYFMEVL